MDLKNQIRRDYFNKTLPGLYTKLFGSLLKTSKQRNHALPPFTKRELIIWCTQEGMDNKFLTYVKSGYNQKLKPSIDRLDDYAPYTFNNMQLVTWGVNDNKGKQDRYSGKNRKVSKNVRMLTLDGKKIREFFSIANASREMKINRSLISNVCLGVKNTTHGYRWEYV